MIAYIKGKVAEILEDRVILEAGSMGYNIFMPMASAEAELRKGDEVKLHTYLNVREDAMQLFGFLTRDDLNTFKLLLGVNGIGPKAALGVLSGLTADELRFAVLADDVKTISRAPGIGKKTAQKLILELKDKMDLQEAFELKTEHVREAQGKESELSDARKEAVEALTALGYSGADALRAVKKVDMTPEMDVETLLKAALKNLF
nr:Holliday junction branch migration protein RuvA [uncultured Blautia sp.]